MTNPSLSIRKLILLKGILAPTNSKTNKGKLNTLLTKRQKSSSFLDLVLERFRLSMRLQKCNATVVASGFLIMCYRDSS